MQSFILAMMFCTYRGLNPSILLRQHFIVSHLCAQSTYCSPRLSFHCNDIASRTHSADKVQWYFSGNNPIYTYLAVIPIQFNDIYLDMHSIGLSDSETIPIMTPKQMYGQMSWATIVGKSFPSPSYTCTSFSFFWNLQKMYVYKNSLEVMCLCCTRPMWEWSSTYHNV